MNRYERWLLDHPEHVPPPAPPEPEPEEDPIWGTGRVATFSMSSLNDLFRRQYAMPNRPFPLLDSIQRVYRTRPEPVPRQMQYTRLPWPETEEELERLERPRTPRRTAPPNPVVPPRRRGRR